MNSQKELGVQSFCFRGFKDNSNVIELVKKCGLSAIEICGVHVDFDDVRAFDDVIRLYHTSGIRIHSIGVQGFSNNERAERKFFEFAKRAGAKMISANFAVGTVPKSYRTAEKLADEYDIDVGIHNHGGYHWLGSSEMLRHTFKNTGKRIGLCLDTAWALDAGQDPVKMAEEFGERLYGVHIKDFVFDRAGNHKDVVVGTGNLDLKKLMATLKKNRFNGSLILEYEGDVNNPVPALKKCVSAVRKAS